MLELALVFSVSFALWTLITINCVWANESLQTRKMNEQTKNIRRAEVKVIKCVLLKAVRLFFHSSCSFSLSTMNCRKWLEQRDNIRYGCVPLFLLLYAYLIIFGATSRTAVEKTRNRKRPIYFQFNLIYEIRNLLTIFDWNVCVCLCVFFSLNFFLSLSWFVFVVLLKLRLSSIDCFHVTFEHVMLWIVVICRFVYVHCKCT